jgi:hypothetical protein
MYWYLIVQDYYQVEPIQTSLVRRSGNEWASIDVKLGDKIVIYGRVADTIFSGLESIGGFFHSVTNIGFVLVFFFQERLFKSSFIRQLYQVDAEVIPENVKVPNSEQMVEEIAQTRVVEESYLK